MLTEHERAERVKKVLAHMVEYRLSMNDVADVLSAAYVTIVAAGSANPAEARDAIVQFAMKAAQEVVPLWIRTDRHNNPENYQDN